MKNKLFLLLAFVGLILSGCDNLPDPDPDKNIAALVTCTMSDFADDGRYGYGKDFPKATTWKITDEIEIESGTELDCLLDQVRNFQRKHKLPVSLLFENAYAVGTSAFSGTSVKYVFLPEVTTLYHFAFQDCESLEILVLSSDKEITVDPQAFIGASTDDTVLWLNSNKEGEEVKNLTDKTYTWKEVKYEE